MPSLIILNSLPDPDYSTQDDIGIFRDGQTAVRVLFLVGIVGADDVFPAGGIHNDTFDGEAFIRQADGVDFPGNKVEVPADDAHDAPAFDGPGHAVPFDQQGGIALHGIFQGDTDGGQGVVFFQIEGWARACQGIDMNGHAAVRVGPFCWGIGRRAADGGRFRQVVLDVQPQHVNIPQHVRE